MSKPFAFMPYKVRSLMIPKEEVFSECNLRMYYAHGSDYRGFRDKTVAYPLFAYQKLLERLCRMHNVEVVTLGDMCTRTYSGDKVRLAIRHDVDIDIVTAVKMSVLESRFGISTSYYFLHTAPYHGRFENNVFYRNTCIGYVYREIQDMGHEIGLHTDGLTVYQKYSMDGADSIRQEIEWLRKQDIIVYGTVAHGSKSVFGAENFEIFKGRRKGKAKFVPCDEDQEQTLFHNGVQAKLHVLNEYALGLIYEGNDVFWQKKVRVEYGATRAVDQWRWNMHLSRSREATEDPKHMAFCVQEEMLSDIENLEPGCYVVLTIHPVYYGCRTSINTAPPLRKKRLQFKINNRMGWETYVPSTPQYWSNDTNGNQEYQSLNFSNELGFLDIPRKKALKRQTNRLKMLFLGGQNLDGREVAVSSQVQNILKDNISRLIGGSVECLKLAYPDMGVGRYWGWYREIRKKFRPDIVFLGISSQEHRFSIPELWSIETGYSLIHPPGNYLTWDSKDSKIVEVKKSRGWVVRQHKPKRLKMLPGTIIPIKDLMGREQTYKINGLDFFVFINACYSYFSECLRADGAQGFLFVTEGGEAAGWNNQEEWKDINPRSCFYKRLHKISKDTGMPLINPYERFNSSDYTDFIHFSDLRWTQVAHRLAAECIFQVLTKTGMIKRIMKKENRLFSL